MPEPSKDEVAQSLAQAHYRFEPDVSMIVRIRGSADVEFQPNEPIKLLEINNTTIPSGIMPLQFGPDLGSGIPYPSVIVEVTPLEYEAIQAHSLPLPEGWSLGEEFPREDNGAAGAG